MTTRRQLTRKKINKNCTAPPSCSCGSPSFIFRAIEVGYILECLECNIDIVISSELLTVGEREWLAKKEYRENRMAQDTEPKPFNNVDELWEMVKPLDPGDCLLVRHERQAAQGVFNDIEDDPRFNDFRVSNARHTVPFQKDDSRAFTICKKRPPPN